MNRLIVLLLLICVMFSVISGCGGHESATTPVCIPRQAGPDEIAISNRTQLAGMGLTGKYILTDNITLAGTDWIPIGDIPTEGDKAVFNGEMDGNCYVITGLTINNSALNNIDDSYVTLGLFAAIDEAKISNLILKDVSIDIDFSDNVSVGSIAGMASDSVIENSYSAGDITVSSGAEAYVGGLVGEEGFFYFQPGNGSTRNGSTIKNSHSTGTVKVSSSYGYVGGLIGSKWSTYGNWNVIDSYSTADVTAYSYDHAAAAGGIIGHAYSVNINNSYSTGSVSAIDEDYGNYYGAQYAGGIAGEVGQSTITNSYSTGNITASGDWSYAGGIVGDVDNSTITNSHSTGNITGDYAGGITGLLDNTSVENSYSTGDVLASSYAGGVVGYAYMGEVINTYSIGNIAGTSEAGGILGIMAYGATLKNSYSTGNISTPDNGTAYERAGGIVGSIENGADTNTITSCVAVNTSISSMGYVGKILGGLRGAPIISISNNFALDTMQATGIAKFINNTIEGGNGTDKTAAELKSRAIYDSLGWDFNNIWTIDEGEGMPVFKYQLEP